MSETPDPSSPFVHDVPAAAATAAWARACREAGCPERVDSVIVPVAEALGRVTAEPVWARRSWKSAVSDAQKVSLTQIRAST